MSKRKKSFPLLRLLGVLKKNKSRTNRFFAYHTHSEKKNKRNKKDKQKGPSQVKSSQIEKGHDGDNQRDTNVIVILCFPQQSFYQG